MLSPQVSSEDENHSQHSYICTVHSKHVAVQMKCNEESHKEIKQHLTTVFKGKIYTTKSFIDLVLTELLRKSSKNNFCF